MINTWPYPNFDLAEVTVLANLEPERIARMLNDSARAVREAIKGRVESGREMNLHYDHPILMLQHMLWHEGYHHGQMKLALKAAGLPMDEEAIGVATWGVWMDKQ